MRIVPSLIIDEHFNHNTGNYSLSLSTLQKLYAKSKKINETAFGVLSGVLSAGEPRGLRRLRSGC
jgi:hypothetical protein